MAIRPIVEADLIEISEWVKSARWPMPIVEDGIPQGIVSTNVDGDLFACAFAYSTGTSVLFVDWILANPQLTDEAQEMAMRDVMRGVTKMAGQITPQVRMIRVVSRLHNIRQVLEPLGFLVKHDYSVSTWIGDSALVSSKKETGKP